MENMSKDSFLPQNRGELVWMTAPNLSAVHAFTTRLGGVSEGIFASWNLGENRGDDPDRVRRNYALLGQALGFDYRDIVFTRQIHENTVRVVTAADRHRLFTPVPYEADGLITDEKNVPLIIFTADCVPILLQDPVRGVIGAVHAGWRGSVLDIAGTAIRQMGSAFGCEPVHIRAAIGPCISQCCFETGPEVPRAMDGCDGQAPGFYREKGNGKCMVDLKGFNRRLLLRAGLLPENICVSGECTLCSHEKYWSHRYTKGERGSQASVILMR